MTTYTDEQLQKSQADAAAMREALEHAHTAINYAVTTGFEDTIKTIVNAALSTNAGRELLGELKRLRTELAEMTTIAEKARTRELEQLDELSTLRTDLAKAQSQCAAMKSVLEQVAEIEVHGQPTALALQAASALSPDCGRDYVHRSEVDMLKIEVQKMASQEMKEGTVRFVATRVS